MPKALHNYFNRLTVLDTSKSNILPSKSAVEPNCNFGRQVCSKYNACCLCLLSNYNARAHRTHVNPVIHVYQCVCQQNIISLTNREAGDWPAEGQGVRGAVVWGVVKAPIYNTFTFHHFTREHLRSFEQ